MKDAKGNTLSGMYEGGASKLANSGAGVLSTIKGKLGSGLSDAGLKLVEALTPKLKGLIPVADKIATALPKAIDSVISGFGKAKDFLVPVFEKMGAYITPIVDKLGSYITPIINIISEGLQNLQPIISDLIETTLPYLQAGIGLISDVFQNILMPIIKVVASIVQNVLKKAFELLGTTVQTVVIPAVKTLTDFINNTLRPILEEGAVILRDVALPIVKKVTDYIASAVYAILKGVVNITSKVVNAFKSVVSAVGQAVNALKGIGSKISGVFGSIKSKVTSWLPGGDGNANGTSYYGGGVTKINERGEELIDLPQGSRIYPQGKTNELIKKDINSKSNSSSKVVYYQPKITINGSNMDKKELMYELDKRLKRMAVNV